MTREKVEVSQVNSIIGASFVLYNFCFIWLIITSLVNGASHPSKMFSWSSAVTEA